MRQIISRRAGTIQNEVRLRPRQSQEKVAVMEATQVRFDHIQQELGKRNTVIADLEKQLDEQVCRICHEKGECHCPEYVSNLEKREAVLKLKLADAEAKLYKAAKIFDVALDKLEKQLAEMRKLAAQNALMVSELREVVESIQLTAQLARDEAGPLAQISAQYVLNKCRAALEDK